MECLKGMIAGIIVGATVGMCIGACNSSMVFDVIKQGKREMKRFKRKYM